MKNTLLSAFIFLGSLTAQASHWGDYDSKQLDLVNKLFELCPKEVNELMTQSYTKIVAGKFVGGRTLEGVATNYTFTFAQTLPAPSFNTTSWTLEADELIKENPNTAPDAPGMITEVTCKVTQN